MAGAGAAVSAADKKFAMEAADGGMAEVQLGQIAVKNAKSDAVKQFGQRMVDDHSKANDQLKDWAGKKGVTLPADVSAKHKAMIDSMSQKSGDAFDRAYMADMVKDHKTDVALFDREANRGTDPDLKSWAAATVPTLREHLKMAEDTNAKVKSGK
jgi:putative membrane protein